MTTRQAKIHALVRAVRCLDVELDRLKSVDLSEGTDAVKDNLSVWQELSWLAFGFHDRARGLAEREGWVIDRATGAVMPKVPLD